jgi:hypothetical protein
MIRKPDRSGRDPGWNRQRLRRSGVQLVVLLVAAFVLFTIGRSLFAGVGPLNDESGGESQPEPSQTSAPTVDLGGVQIPANGQPVIILNPGLVRPGATLAVNGSGFDAHSKVDVFLAPVQVASPGQEPSAENESVPTDPTASVTAGKDGSISTNVTMPADLGGSSKHEVIARQRGSAKEARAQAVTASGVATLTLSEDAGRPGDTVTVTAQGFQPDETVNVHWGSISGQPAAALKADQSGNVGRSSVRVGVGVAGNNTLFLIGQKSKAAATGQFLLLGLYPVASVDPYAVKAGQSVKYSGKGFAPGERVLVYINAQGGTPVLTATANNSGAFSASGFTVPFGLTGKQALILVGEQSRASVNTGFSILPYTPTARASTYGALPGTEVSFYATGFAPKEAVHVFVGGNQGEEGELVSAFRVNDQGSASAAGRYLIPGTAGNALTFTLRGAKSKGSASMSLTVDKPGQPVNVPPAPKYTLPPDLRE